MRNIRAPLSTFCRRCDGGAWPPRQCKICTRVNDSSLKGEAFIRTFKYNSVRNKFYSIPPLVEHNIDIFALAEVKSDSSFPQSQFLAEGMKKPDRFDVSSRKGELLVYVNKNISSKYLRSFHLPNDTEAISIETVQTTGCFNIHTSRSKVSIFSVIYNRFTWPLP